MIEQGVSAAAFDAFSVSSDWAGAPVDIVLDREVEVIDSEGNVRGTAARIDVKHDDVPVAWSAGDQVAVTLEGVPLTFSIAEKLEDDGYIAQFLAHPV